MCSSSCLPGGGSNTELALHCLHACRGNTMVRSEIFISSLCHSTFHRSSMHHDSPPSILTHPLILFFPSLPVMSSAPQHASSVFFPSCPPSLPHVQATLEMLLFSQSLPTGDYHYSGNL